jgi:hypothetical protein
MATVRRAAKARTVRLNEITDLRRNRIAALPDLFLWSPFFIRGFDDCPPEPLRIPIADDAPSEFDWFHRPTVVQFVRSIVG